MKIVVCGGGISGLAAAYYSAKFANSSAKVILLEKSNEVGGWMKTSEVKDGGPVNELAPRSIGTAGITGQNTLEFVSNLQLEKYVLPADKDSIALKQRFIYYKNKLHAVPHGLSFLTPESFQRDYPEELITSVKSDTKASANDETMYDVGRAHFGEDVTDVFFSAFSRGVYAADHTQLSMKAAFPTMWNAYKPEQGSLPLRPSLKDEEEHSKHLKTVPLVQKAHDEGWKMWATTHGFSHFNEKISDRLQDMGVDVIRGAQVTKISEDGNKLLSVQYQEHGATTTISDVDHVISALPSHQLSSILKNSAEATSPSFASDVAAVAEKLDCIPWVDVAVVNVEYSGSPESNLPQPGFGHFIPSSEPSNCNYMIYDSCCFPAHDRSGEESTRLTCVMGGSWFPKLVGDPDQVQPSLLEDLALNDIKKQLGITKDPVSVTTTVHRKTLPTYKVGHTELVENVEQLLKNHNLHLVGNSYWGVNLNDCIYNSRITASNILLTNVTK